VVAGSPQGSAPAPADPAALAAIPDLGRKNAMDLILIRGFAAFQYIDPEVYLRRLRSPEIEIVHSDLPANVRHLRTHELKATRSGGALRFSPMGWSRLAGLRRGCGRAHRSRDGPSRLEPAL